MDLGDRVAMGFAQILELTVLGIEKVRNAATRRCACHAKAPVTDQSRHSHRSDKRIKPRPDLAGPLHLFGCLANRLHDKRDCSFVAMEICNGSGMRSLASWDITITNWPSLAAFAING